LVDYQLIFFSIEKRKNNSKNNPAADHKKGQIHEIKKYD